ncbi:hypothetical protein D3C83_120900 [compost metagenome]
MRATQFEIILAMVWRHVHEARATVGGDEIAGQEGSGPGEEAAEMVHRVAGNRTGEVGPTIGSERMFLQFDRLR